MDSGGGFVYGMPVPKKLYHCPHCKESMPFLHAEPGIIRCQRCSSPLTIRKPPCGTSGITALEVSKEDDDE